MPTRAAIVEADEAEVTPVAVEMEPWVGPPLLRDEPCHAVEGPSVAVIESLVDRAVADDLFDASEGVGGLDRELAAGPDAMVVVGDPAGDPGAETGGMAICGGVD